MTALIRRLRSMYTRAASWTNPGRVRDSLRATSSISLRRSSRKEMLTVLVFCAIRQVCIQTLYEETHHSQTNSPLSTSSGSGWNGIRIREWTGLAEKEHILARPLIQLLRMRRNIRLEQTRHRILSASSTLSSSLPNSGGPERALSPSLPRN